ncbi:hypothetical protein SCHPADRAFT_822109 [Schizopora paradoxa]|uniref:Uncharacterized protein n=1 Tax=Schizopora paradoxa TaxID=27342 RepID=A0A0H2RYC4_9AGAM|nr:hypothetical protein SCHPADRAFT_822109 [Schizopora paradoxa]
MSSKTESNERPRTRTISFQLPTLNAIDAVTEYLQNAGTYVLEKIRQASPLYIPILICLAAIPLLMLLSLFAGWSVWRSVPTGWHRELYLQYGVGSTPYASVELPWLDTWQPYDIYLHVSVPATESNYALGNFMTVLTISTLNNETLTTVSKPSIILPPSSGVLTSMFRSSRVLEFVIPMLSSYYAQAENLRAYVEVGRRDGWKSLGHGEGRELSVIAAAIRGEVRPTGIKRILSMFPMSVAIASTVAFFITSILILACCLIPSMFRSHEDEEEKGKKSPTVEVYYLHYLFFFQNWYPNLRRITLRQN